MSASSTAIRPVRAPRWRRILRRLPWWIAVAFLVGVAILWIYPFVWMLSASLKDNMEVFAAGLKLIPSSFHFENYVRAWEDANFGRYLINTVIVTLWTVFIVTVRCACCRLRAGTVSLPRLQNLHGHPRRDPVRADRVHDHSDRSGLFAIGRHRLAGRA